MHSGRRCPLHSTARSGPAGRTFQRRIFRRNGLRLGNLTPAQRKAAMTLMSTALSASRLQEGHRHHERRRGAEEQGRRKAGRAPGGGVQFGADEYFIALLGTPSPTTPWMIQFGGHHLAINVTVVGANSVMTPSLPAAQPAKFHVERRDHPAAGQGERQRLRAHQRARRRQLTQAVLSYR